jgi:hypothetical protein
MRYGRDYDRNFVERTADEVRGWFGNDRGRSEYDHGLRGGRYDRGMRGYGRGGYGRPMSPMEHERTIRPSARYDRVYRGAEYDRGYRGVDYDRGYRGGPQRYDSDHGRDARPLRGEIEGWRDLGLRPGEYREMMARRGPRSSIPRGPDRSYGMDGIRPRNETGLGPGRYFKGWGVDQRP